MRKVLERNDKKNVILFTHNPTRDTFGTKHEMNPSDAAELEKILGDYKEGNPDKSVTVLFGHLHTIQSWEVDGVKYIINGDGAGKKYVAPVNGGLLAYTKIVVNGNQVKHRFVPLVKSISVVDNANQGGVLKIAEGATRHLDLQGDFSILSSDYILSLNRFPDLEMRFTSSDAGIVTVDDAGNLTAHLPGVAQVTAEVAGKEYTFSVQSIPKTEIVPIKVKISPETLEVRNEPVEFQLAAYDKYGNAFALDSKDAEWSVTPSSIGRIEDGRFTPVTTGQDIAGEVVATYRGFTVKAKVTVKESPIPKEIRVEPSELNLTAGSTARLTAVVNDQHGLPIYDLPIVWSSDDKNIATIDQSGLVTAVSGGNTVIRATYGDLMASAKVTVQVGTAPPGGGDNGGGSGGGGPSPSSGTPPGASPPVSDSVVNSALEQAAKTGKVTLEAAPDKAALALKTEQVNRLTEQARPVEVKIGRVQLVVPAAVLKAAAALAPDVAQIEVQARPVAKDAGESLVKGAKNAARFKLAGEVFELELCAFTKDGKKQSLTAFSAPVKIVLPAPAEKRAPAAKLLIARHNEKEKLWEPLPTVYDEKSGTFTAETNSFSKYALLEEVAVAPLQPPVKTFADIQGHWAQKDIELMAQKEVVHGVAPDRFAPQAPVTRAEFAAMLVNALGVTETGPVPFKDVPAAGWYAQSVAKAYAAGLVKGVSADEFAPQAPVTRQEMAAMLVRALAKLGYPAEVSTGEETQILSSFTDRQEIAPWAANVLAAAVKAGLVAGRAETLVAPAAGATRAESVVLIKRLLQRTGKL